MILIWAKDQEENEQVWNPERGVVRGLCDCYRMWGWSERKGEQVSLCHQNITTIPLGSVSQSRFSTLPNNAPHYSLIFPCENMGHVYAHVSFLQAHQYLFLL